MAGLSVSLDVSSEAGDMAKVQEILVTQYHMPTRAWWDNANTTFTKLCRVLERSSIETFEGDENSYSSARKANAGSYPVVKLFKAGTHLLELATSRDALQCVAFGTIPAQRYIQIFWEEVSNVQRSDKNVSMAVFSAQVESDGSASFSFRYGRISEP
jgi:hypothetical protein